MRAEKPIAAITTVTAAGLAVLCCAGPLLLGAIGSIAISASVLTGSLAIVAGVLGVGLVGAWTYRRNRSADPNAVDCRALENTERKSNS